MLVRLLYASRASGPITEDVITSILTQSRRNNVETGVTGVLCVCHGDVFMQALEGGRKQVNDLYAKVLRDQRHADVILLEYGEITERRFADWRMGRVDLDKVNAGLILRYSEQARLDPFRISGRVAMKLLEDLAGAASIVGGN
ncbi:MAG: BLUF domain-containing protein [Phycisphaerales bacterium JB039]